MKRYIPTSSGPISEQLDKALWALSMPEAGQSPVGTSRIFGTIQTLDGTWWLEAEDTYEIRVHPDAELGDIQPILQPWIDDGLLPASEVPALAQTVEDHKGQMMNVWDNIPALFQSQSKTRAELIAAGLIQEVPTP